MAPVGLVIGKFMPPHMGHVHLFDFAQQWTKDVTIVVEHIEGEPIPSALRAAWVAELAPRARVVHLDRPMPQRPEDHPRFWRLWAETLREVTGRAPDVLFASEHYGAPLSQALGCHFVPVDVARSAVSISATRVRADPQAEWGYLPAPVRAWYARRIAVVGPESTGKTTLSKALAAHLGASWVGEHARACLEQAGAGPLDWPVMLDQIARGQRAAEEALARQCGGVLVCDTDLVTTAIWSEVLTGACEPGIDAASRSMPYAHTLLCDVDLPWEPDPVRYRPDDRAGFFARFERALEQRGRAYTVISGAGPARLAAAIAAVAAHLPAAALVA